MLSLSLCITFNLINLQNSKAKHLLRGHKHARNALPEFGSVPNVFHTEFISFEELFRKSQTLAIIGGIWCCGFEGFALEHAHFTILRDVQVTQATMKGYGDEKPRATTYCFD